MKSKYVADYVSLAEASYADFTGVSDITNSKDKAKETIERIKDSGNDRPTQFGELVTKNYTVEAHWQDKGNDDNPQLSESGFSGTLFKSKEGKYVIAMRGTAGNQDLVETDVKDIVKDGLAHQLDINANRNYYNI